MFAFSLSWRAAPFLPVALAEAPVGGVLDCGGDLRSAVCSPDHFVLLFLLGSWSVLAHHLTKINDTGSPEIKRNPNDNGQKLVSLEGPEHPYGCIQVKQNTASSTDDIILIGLFLSVITHVLSQLDTC